MDQRIVNSTCPCCGAPLTFSGATGKLECESCGNSFDAEALELMNEDASGGGVSFRLAADTFGSGDGVTGFICKNCGAELMTDSTTTATACPYCGSPAILPDRIEGGVKPVSVVPFVITQEQAKKQFDDYFQGKRLLPNVFLNSANRIAEMRKLFVPYWLFDCDARANMVFEGEKKTTSRQGEWEITRTAHYLLQRAGDMHFEDIPVDGSVKMNDAISESLEPYDLTKAVPFTPAVLSGSMADQADVGSDACQLRARERVESSIESAVRASVSGYSNLNVRSRHITSSGGTATPVLLPVWLITTEKEGKTYTFAINGQTGKLTCDVPYAKGKARAWFAGIAGGVFAAGYALLVILKAMGVIG